jgi:hypothetical protein
MDLYDRGILKAGDAAVPVIRIFFALAARTPCLHVTRHDPSSTYNAIIYDIWCAGLSPEFLNPIRATYQHLARPPASIIWLGKYL